MKERNINASFLRESCKKLNDLLKVGEAVMRRVVSQTAADETARCLIIPLRGTSGDLEAINPQTSGRCDRGDK